MNDDDELLAVKAAELYYNEDKTQGEIGALLQITRWKVGRLIVHAKEAGYVRIEIVHPRARRGHLERDLCERFSLQDAVVVPSLDQNDPIALRQRVAEAAAEYLTSMRPVTKLLGISWGRTLHDVASALRQDWARGVHVVQINGGVSLNRRASSAADTAAMIARKGHGSASMLPSPAILERVETKIAIENDRTVAGVLDSGRHADTCLFSAGPADLGSVLSESGYLSQNDLLVLRSRGAVGDVLGRFIDANGYPVDPELDERTVGLGLDDLRNAQRSIAVISGEAKHDVCRTVVSSGLCTVLITDEITAQHLLDESLCK
ncbi:sugar-binding domain-containing protein [Leucobacter sp. gxy201]|uniref:sugar-binding transcriptional regulator n=1 Tax=Leucobacter sp. gxy201 TaxID=2957200 RepID=UPI003DA059DF